jgi:DNA polymerase
MSVTKADTQRRFVGKTCILGLGYGMGYKRLRHTLFIGQGGVSVKIDEDTAQELVKFYRVTYSQIPRLWHRMGYIAEYMIGEAGRKPMVQVTESETKLVPAIRVGHDALVLPNGMRICYPEIRHEQVFADGRVEYQLGYGKLENFRKLFGGKITENVSQALARIVVTDIMLRVHEQTGYHPCLTTYDSIDYCVPVEDAGAMDALLEREFAVRPSWAPRLPLASEGGYGRTLAIAENEKHPDHNQ